MSAYDINGQLAATGRPAASPQIVPGTEPFAASIETVSPEEQATLRRLLNWAMELEGSGLAVLYTSIGKDRWILNLRLPGQSRAMISLWNDRKAYVSPYRTVLEQEAPTALAALEAMAPGQIGHGSYLRVAYDDELLQLLRDAYEEAHRRLR